MEKVLISGGSGLIGQYLSIKLKERGYGVKVLTRSLVNGDGDFVHWNVSKGIIDIDAVNEANYIIHLAGANIAEKPWTASRKKQIIDSRVLSTKLIFDNVPQFNTKLKAFISASAVGYYGAITQSNVFAEEDSSANDFLGNTCFAWEQAADQFLSKKVRVVKLRTGVVLTEKGGALQKLQLPIKWGLGSALGTGKQFMNWVHIDDLCSMYIKAIEDEEMQGAYNAVAPEQVTNNDFSKTIAELKNKPYWLPKVPSFVLRVLLGEMSVMLLNGSKVSSNKIQREGFTFLFPKLEDALKNLLVR